ncbi:MAG: hypothetical protein AAF340_04545 [Pseudomonadota bacterium]
MRLLFTLGCLGISALMAQLAIAQPTEPDPINQADEAPYIRSALPLDEPRHLCIDLPGHGSMTNPDAPFSVHTCKDGMWNYDERFRWTADDAGLEMPQYENCLAAEAASAGASVILAECGSATAKILFENARLKLSADPTLCVTIADGRSELTPGGKRFPQRYRSRSLSFEPCSDAAIERQLWSITQPLDLETTLMPPAGSLPVDE